MRSRRIKKLFSVFAIILMTFSFVFYSPSIPNSENIVNADETEVKGEFTPSISTAYELELEPYYYSILDSWKNEGISLGESEVEIDMKDFVRHSEDAEVKVENFKDRENVLTWNSIGGWVEYSVDIADEGLYEIGVDYFPFPQSEGGSRQSVILGVQVNGEYPFRESRSIDLKRDYRDREDVYDEKGNQIRSLIDEIEEWKTDRFRDSNGASSGPLLYHFKKGQNTIRLYLLREIVAFDKMVIRPPKIYQTYGEVKDNYPSQSTESNEIVIFEAEEFERKNSTSVQVQYDRDPMTTPESLRYVKFNTLGGWSWYKGRQAVTWEFEVPEDGLYKLGFRGLQNYRKNLAVFRTVYIDGEIPFDEMKVYKIPYATGWQEIILQDEDENPYLFYLEKGKHTLKLEATYEPFVPILDQMDVFTKQGRSISEELRLATGSREDSFRVWNVERELPGVLELLNEMREDLLSMADQIIEINDLTSNVSQAFNSLASEIESLLKKPNEIPNRQLRISTLQERLEGQRNELMDSPLQIDKFYVAPEQEKFPRMTSNFFEKIKGTFNSLVYSFFGQYELAEQVDEELNVWMMWGRDYAEELQQLSDQYFTPEHGVKVNVNLIQDANLLIMAKAAGIMPDVALGIPSGMPFEMAVRGAAKDFSTLPGSMELLSSYAPGILLPYYYDGGYYGIPETINFKVMFYRKDILDQLDLEVPNTWDEVYQMMPTLLQNQHNFFADPKDFSYMLFQNGVELYTPNGMASGLSETHAIQAFEEWTNLFNLHGMDLQVASFYQQFRNGLMPIGIADFNQYMQLLVAAPEILDLWGIAPIPGHVNDKGEIVRWAGGTGIGTTSMMLFNDTPEHKQDLAWEFIKWYSSTEIQTEYGLNLEQFRGETFRWNSANVEAFAEMPWRPADLEVILEQWRWVKDIPNVPGGYMTLRHIDFAWNQTVIEGENPRIELEEGVKEINRELVRKQIEFGLVDENGKIIRELDVPIVDEPWEGVSRVGR